MCHWDARSHALMAWEAVSEQGAVATVHAQVPVTNTVGQNAGGPVVTLANIRATRVPIGRVVFQPSRDAVDAPHPLFIGICRSHHSRVS